MPAWGGVAAFFAVFFGAGAFIFIASGRQRKRWRARPAILRALAARRGYSVVDNPGKPSELVPIRPLEQRANLRQMELPVAVHGRTIDGDFTLFDVFTRVEDKIPGRHTWDDSYETFITIKSGRDWPHFEFAAIAHPKDGSIAAALVEITAALTQSLMSERGLARVPIPQRPGYQLFVDPNANAGAIRDALVPLADARGPWWIGGLGDSLTLQMRESNSPTQASLVAEKDIDRFIDEAMAIERAARSAIPK